MEHPSGTGDYAPVVQNGVAVYIFMAEHDEYYGPERARSAYNSLHDAYIAAGWSEGQIGEILQIQTPWMTNGLQTAALPITTMAAET